MKAILHRESQFELLRIIAQWMIVLYHLLLLFTKNHQLNHPIFQGIQIPLHIGVILFVLISGYFGIKRSFKGIIKLLAITATYSIPIAFITNGIGGETIKNLLFISYTPYWFVRTYLFLFLLSPMLNQYLNRIDFTQRVFFISVLAYMAVWMGTLRCDTSLAGGKNVINFFLIYSLGNTLRVYREKWITIRLTRLLSIYLILNLLLVVLWIKFRNNIIGDGIIRLSFWYCSPIIYINAILVFMIFGKLNFSSRCINYCASSVFAIYLIHCEPFVLNKVIAYGATAILNFTHAEDFSTLLLFGIYALAIVVICISIDKLLTPLWRLVSMMSDRLENRFHKMLIIGNGR